MLRKCADSQAGIGTGKTHTLIEIIQQLTREMPDNSNRSRVLVCGASNLAVDNILERLLALPAVDKIQKLKVTRIGHPARVMAHEGILGSTLEVKATLTDQVNLMHGERQNLAQVICYRQLSREM